MIQGFKLPRPFKTRVQTMRAREYSAGYDY